MSIIIASTCIIFVLVNYTYDWKRGQQNGKAEERCKHKTHSIDVKEGNNRTESTWAVQSGTEEETPWKRIRYIRMSALERRLSRTGQWALLAVNLEKARRALCRRRTFTSGALCLWPAVQARSAIQYTSTRYKYTYTRYSFVIRARGSRCLEVWQ